jgi:penicillin-binding protein 2
MRKSHFNPFKNFTTHQNLSAGEYLEWEEGVQDHTSPVEGFDEDGRQLRNLWWLKISLIFTALILVVQLINLQIVQGEQMRELAEGNRLRLRTILAPRGIIQDRYGEVLAKNTASFALTVTPADLPKENMDEIFNEINKLFGVSSEELHNKVAQAPYGSLSPIVVKRHLTQQESIAFEVVNRHLPGFSLLSTPIRDYLWPEIFSHALGYTSVISQEEYRSLEQEKYGINDFIGKSGIELSYEKYLRGSNGSRQVEVDAIGKSIKELGIVEPIPGNVVELNIDAGLQKIIYEGFTKNKIANKGAAIAMDPRNGEVLALVSVPGFNNNLFAPGISKTDYQQLITNTNLPLFNRAISGTYPPGSTIKPVGAAAVLQEGVVRPDTIIVDRGLLVIPNQFNPSVLYNFVGWKRDGLGPMNVRSAIAESSDIYFYTVSGGHTSSNISGLGAEKFAEYYRRFGMGALAGIDIAGEQTGRVADPAWKASFYQGNAIASKWYLGDTYHISIGQGDMLATPLQVAMWTAVIANNGQAYKPRVFKQANDLNGKLLNISQPELLLDVRISKENLTVVQAGMRDNVTSSKGSGRSLASLPISSAGKTGTSQFDGSDPSRTHAWYTVYAPYENPQIVITILVEAGGEGHAVAVPIVKNALDWWAKNRLLNH